MLCEAWYSASKGWATIGEVSVLNEVIAGTAYQEAHLERHAIVAHALGSAAAPVLPLWSRNLAVPGFPIQIDRVFLHSFPGFVARRFLVVGAIGARSRGGGGLSGGRI